MTPDRLCAEILQLVHVRKTDNFSGLGLVFYRQLSALPHAALGPHSSSRPQLPVCGAEAIAEVLAEIADQNSPWHDGFHLIDIQTESLTHLSQFLSPDVRYSVDIGSERPNGARQMAALLASRTDGIVEVGLITPSGEISFFTNGIQHLLKIE
ncbi:MAG: hypothetical protein AB7E72_01475 [Lysobacterales bacterium]